MSSSGSSSPAPAAPPALPPAASRRKIGCSTNHTARAARSTAMTNSITRGSVGELRELVAQPLELGGRRIGRRGGGGRDRLGGGARPAPQRQREQHTGHDDHEPG